MNKIYIFSVYTATLFGIILGISLKVEHNINSIVIWLVPVVFFLFSSYFFMNSGTIKWLDEEIYKNDNKILCFFFVFSFLCFVVFNLMLTIPYFSSNFQYFVISNIGTVLFSMLSIKFLHLDRILWSE